VVTVLQTRAHAQDVRPPVHCRHSMSLVIAEPHAWLAVGGQRLSEDLGVDLADLDLGLGDRVRVAGRFSASSSLAAKLSANNRSASRSRRDLSHLQDDPGPQTRPAGTRDAQQARYIGAPPAPHLR
jgi:hypothetical protein